MYLKIYLVEASTINIIFPNFCDIPFQSVPILVGSCSIEVSLNTGHLDYGRCSNNQNTPTSLLELYPKKLELWGLKWIHTSRSPPRLTLNTPNILLVSHLEPPLKLRSN